MAGRALGLAVDAARAAQLIRRQFPPLATLPVTPLGEGGDHRAFAVGGPWVFRLPKLAGGGEALLNEARLLTWLAPRLPLSVPVVRFIGQPSDLFPEVFTGAVRLEGNPGLGASKLDSMALGRALGRFLRTLHAQDRATAQALGLPLDFDPTFADWRTAALEDAGAATDAGHLPDFPGWARVLGQLPISQPERLTVLHGDLAAEHVFLSDRAEITGILDWADAAIGDPARDLAGLIHWGGRSMLNAALGEYGAVDAGFMGRAAWYAACRAVGDLAFGQAQARPEYVQAGRRILNLLQTDFAPQLAGTR